MRKGSIRGARRRPRYRASKKKNPHNRPIMRPSGAAAGTVAVGGGGAWVPPVMSCSEHPLTCTVAVPGCRYRAGPALGGVSGPCGAARRRAASRIEPVPRIPLKRLFTEKVRCRRGIFSLGFVFDSETLHENRILKNPKNFEIS